MTRFLDLVAILIVAVLVLLPQPGVNVFPAVQGDKTDLDRLAGLEDARYRAPQDPQAAVELARAYLRVDQPAWAVAALEPFFGRNEHQVHQVAAYAYATLLLPQEALKQAEQGLAACDAQPSACPDMARIRLQYLAELMRQSAQTGVDPQTDPLRARQLVREALRATKPNMRPPTQPTAAPAPAPSH
ncbi:MAG TPA: hypothetical protein PKI03_17505 [Pseudomonadota bacterium]|nr:hypothetical protein [Pseudomonadota bacterium]